MSSRALAVLKEEFVLVLGHGVTVEGLSTSKPRRELAQLIASRYRGQSSVFEEAAALYEKYSSLNSVIRCLMDFETPLGRPYPIWCHLARWPVRTVVDFSWNRLYEAGCIKEEIVSASAVTEGDVAYLGGCEREVLHLRGLIRRPETLVLSLNHFERALGRQGNPELWAYAARAADNKPIVMLGMDAVEVDLFFDYFIMRHSVQVLKEKVIVIHNHRYYSNDEFYSIEDMGITVIMLESSISDFANAVANKVK